MMTGERGQQQNQDKLSTSMLISTCYLILSCLFIDFSRVYP